jgi:DNA replication and repair protein RecF
MYRGNTNAGPHRDDFRITIGGQDARIYGSQGQQRSAMIALRLAEINLMKAYTGLTPILLLDDIVSELDERRRLHFLSLLDPNLQTFITGTDADTLRGALPVEKTFQICNGRIL